MSGIECQTWLPCAFSISGNIILIAMYGAVIAFASKTIAEGSDLLLELLDPGFVGGFILPVLGALPDSLIIVMSCLGDNAQEQLDVGMGTLAGSTIMLLTIPWFGSMLVGRCDLDPQTGRQIDFKCSKWSRESWSKQGVSVDHSVPFAALVMLLTGIAYLVVQGPAFAWATATDPESEYLNQVESGFALAGFVIAGLNFVLFSVYQVWNTKQQAKRKELARQETVIKRTIEKMRTSLAHVRREASMRNVVAKFRGLLRGNSAGSVNSSSDLPVLAAGDVAPAGAGAGAGPADAPKPAAGPRTGLFAAMVARAAAANSTASGASGASASSSSAAAATAAGASPRSPTAASTLVPPGARPAADEGSDDDDDDDEEKVEGPKWKIAMKSLAMLLIGTAMVAVFSDPMVDAISNFSFLTGLPSFFVSFIVTPFASNASEMIASLYFAAKKKQSNTSVTFAQLYGAATMNNTLGLGVFCALVYFKNLRWSFSAEVAVILFVMAVVGTLAMRRTLTMKLMWPVLALYPLSIALVALLEAPFIAWK